MIDAAVSARAGHDDPIGGGRRLFLVHLRKLIEDNGLPLPKSLRRDACSMPYVFQELNYDGYDWSSRTADLGRLADIVDIDVIVWSGGLGRSELTDSQFSEYFTFCLDAISYRGKRKPA